MERQRYYIEAPDGTKTECTEETADDDSAMEVLRAHRAEQIHEVRTGRRQPEARTAEVIYKVPGRLLNWLLRESPAKADELLSVRARGLKMDVSRRAHHESGHAFALHAVGNLNHTEVYAEQVEGRGGQTGPKESWLRREHPVQRDSGRWGPSKADQEYARQHLVALYAGGAALRRFLLLGGAADDEDLALTVLYGNTDDRREGERILQNLGLNPREEIVTFRERAEADAIHFVSTHWEQIASVAQELVKRAEDTGLGRLTDEELRDLVGGVTTDWRAGGAMPQRKEGIQRA